MTGGPSTAWALAAMAVGHALKTKPLADGISMAKVGHWNLRLNNAKTENDGLEPFGIEAKSDEYVAVAIFTPNGGMIGGYPEDKFIADMASSLPAEEVAPFLEDIP